MELLPLKFGGLKQENSGPDFGQLSDLTANNFGMEQHVVNRKSALKGQGQVHGEVSAAGGGIYTRRRLRVEVSSSFRL